MSGTGIDVPNLPKFPVPVLISYRTYRVAPYRYGCRTELTEVSGTDIDVPVPVPAPVQTWVHIPAVCTEQPGISRWYPLR